MTRGLVLQVLVSGLAAGAVYGLVAIGFSLVWRLTSVLQFAHGDLLGASLFVALTAGGWPLARGGVSTVAYLAGVAAAVAFAALAGAALYLAILRPLRGGGTSAVVGATVAVAFAVQGALPALFRREGYVFADPLPFDRWRGIAVGDGVTISVRTIWIILAGSAIAFGARWLIERTRFGSAVQAASSDSEAAQLVGLPVRRLTAIAFAVAGALAAIAGVLGAPALASLTPATGLTLGLKGIAAAMIGGLGRPGRVFAGGLALGVAEAAIVNLHVPGFPSLALGPAWRDVAPILIAIAVLAVRPAGGVRERIE